MKRLVALVALGLSACVQPPAPAKPLPPVTLRDTCFDAASRQIKVIWELYAPGNYRLHFYAPVPSNDAPRLWVTGVQVWTTRNLPVGLEFENTPGVWVQVAFVDQAPPDLCP